MVHFFSKTIPFAIRKTVSLLRSKQNSTYRGMTAQFENLGELVKNTIFVA